MDVIQFQPHPQKPNPFSLFKDMTPLSPHLLPIACAWMMGVRESDLVDYHAYDPQQSESNEKAYGISL